MEELVGQMNKIETRLNELQPKVDAGTLTAEERAELTRLTAELDQAEAEMKAIERAKNRKADRAKAAAKNNPEKQLTERFRVLRAAKLLTGRGNFDGAEAEVHAEAVKEARETGVEVPSNGIGIPSWVNRGIQERTMEQRAPESVGTATSAGNTVATELYDMIPALRPKLVLGNLGASVWTGLKGNVDIPAGDAVSSASFTTETGTASETTPTTKLVSMTPKRLAAWTGITMQLLNQSSISVDNWVASELSDAEARKIDSVGMVGGGSNEPVGIIGNGSTTVIAIGTNGGNLTRALLLAMETQVEIDNADTMNMGYLTTPGTKGFLKNLISSSGVGPFVWENDNTIMGYRATVSNQMPKTLDKGTSTGVCHAAIFGDFSRLIIGNWGVRYLTVDNVTKAKSGQIDLVMNSFWDSAIVHPKGFVVIKDITI